MQLKTNIPNCLSDGWSFNVFPRYLFKGKNSLGSTHVKQTPHNPDMMWASNTYLIVFQGRYSTLISVQVDYDTLVQDGRHEDDDLDRGGTKGQGACMISRDLQMPPHTYLKTQFNI